MSERQIERMQEQLFRESGPYYHLHTKPLEKGLIFQEEEERKVAINFIAIIAKEVNVDILALALMNNHFHFIIRGEKVDVLEFFRRLKKRLAYFLARKFTWWVFKNVEAQVGVAMNMEEHPNLSDDQLFVVTMRICEDRFNKKGNNELTGQERKQLAVTLKNDWYASNAQIARLSGLAIQAVNELFPMAAKQKLLMEGQNAPFPSLR